MGESPDPAQRKKGRCFAGLQSDEIQRRHHSDNKPTGFFIEAPCGIPKGDLDDETKGAGYQQTLSKVPRVSVVARFAS